MRKDKKILLTLSFLMVLSLFMGNPLGSQVSELSSSRPHPSPAVDLSHAYAFPVPFKPSYGQAHINFINLSSEATVRIFDVNGSLVRTLHESTLDGVIRWDVTDESGRPVNSDVFFYLIENSEQVKSGKLLVVR